MGWRVPPCGRVPGTVQSKSAGTSEALILSSVRLASISSLTWFFASFKSLPASGRRETSIFGISFKSWLSDPCFPMRLLFKVCRALSEDTSAIAFSASASMLLIFSFISDFLSERMNRGHLPPIIGKQT